MNKVILKGRLGGDPEAKELDGGSKVVNFSVATNWQKKVKKGKKESWEDQTEWHNLVAWNKTGDFIYNHFEKGDSILIEGALRTRKWEDKDGNDRYTTEILVDKAEFAGFKKETEE